jgi:hypothetical protein
MSKSIDVSDIILLLGAFSGNSKKFDVLPLSDNKKFTFCPPEDTDSWKGDPAVKDPSDSLLVLSFNNLPFDPSGWKCGSSEKVEICDIQLAVDNRTAVSRSHLRFDINPLTLLPRIKVLSRNGAYVTGLQTLREVTLTQEELFDISESVSITIGLMVFHAWRPRYNKEELKAFQTKASQFNRDILHSRRKYPQTVDLSGQPTASCRFGQNSTVYSLGKRLGSGIKSSVYEVQELRSNKVFAAKEPYSKHSDGDSKIRSSWEDVQHEHDLLRKLQHVSTILL